MRWLISLLLLAPTARIARGQESASPWKAGVASQVITPKKNVWMAGYASRKTPAEGKAQELFAKALALEDHQAQRFVIVTLDLIGITRAMREEVARQAEQDLRLPKERLLLNVSHAHGGSWSSASFSDLRSHEGAMEEAEEYMRELQDALVQVIGKALQDLRPVQIGYSHARVGFAINSGLPSALKAVMEDVTLQFVPLSRDDFVRMSMSKDAYEVRASCCCQSWRKRAASRTRRGTGRLRLIGRCSSPIRRS